MRCEREACLWLQMHELPADWRGCLPSAIGHLRADNGAGLWLAARCPSLVPACFLPSPRGKRRCTATTRRSSTAGQWRIANRR